MDQLYQLLRIIDQEISYLQEQQNVDDNLSLALTKSQKKEEENEIVQHKLKRVETFRDSVIFKQIQHQNYMLLQQQEKNKKKQDEKTDKQTDQQSPAKQKKRRKKNKEQEQNINTQSIEEALTPLQFTQPDINVQISDESKNEDQSGQKRKKIRKHKKDKPSEQQEVSSESQFADNSVANFYKSIPNTSESEENGQNESKFNQFKFNYNYIKSNLSITHVSEMSISSQDDEYELPNPISPDQYIRASFKRGSIVQQSTETHSGTIRDNSVVQNDVDLPLIGTVCFRDVSLSTDDDDNSKFAQQTLSETNDVAVGQISGESPNDATYCPKQLQWEYQSAVHSPAQEQAQETQLDPIIDGFVTITLQQALQTQLDITQAAEIQKNATEEVPVPEIEHNLNKPEKTKIDKEQDSNYLQNILETEAQSNITAQLENQNWTRTDVTDDQMQDKECLQVSQPLNTNNIVPNESDAVKVTQKPIDETNQASVVAEEKPDLVSGDFITQNVQNESKHITMVTDVPQKIHLTHRLKEESERMPDDAIVQEIKAHDDVRGGIEASANIYCAPVASMIFPVSTPVVISSLGAPDRAAYVRSREKRIAELLEQYKSLLLSEQELEQQQQQQISVLVVQSNSKDSPKKPEKLTESSLQSSIQASTTQGQEDPLSVKHDSIGTEEDVQHSACGIFPAEPVRPIALANQGQKVAFQAETVWGALSGANESKIKSYNIPPPLYINRKHSKNIFLERSQQQFSDSRIGTSKQCNNIFTSSGRCTQNSTGYGSDVYDLPRTGMTFQGGQVVSPVQSFQKPMEQVVTDQQSLYVDQQLSQPKQLFSPQLIYYELLTQKDDYHDIDLENYSGNRCDEDLGSQCLNQPSSILNSNNKWSAYQNYEFKKFKQQFCCYQKADI